MEINFIKQPGRLTIQPKGELDHHSAVSAREEIDLAVSTGFYRQILYSLEELTFMDSSGISLIANGYKTASLLGAKVLVYTENPKYLKIFTLSKLDDLVQIISTRKDLLKLWK